MQITFPLNNAAQKPTLALGNFDGCTALIDTGAMLPMWIKDKESLEAIGGYKTGYNQTITTADGKIITKELYRLTVHLGDIIFVDMPILLSPISSKALKNIHVILAATNFRGMVYTIDTLNDTLTLDIKDGQKVRNVKVVDESGNIDILANQVAKHSHDEVDFQIVDEEGNALTDNELAKQV